MTATVAETWRELEARTCKAKHPFTGAGDAHEAARRARARGEATVRAYPCPWCARYHVGHLPSLDALERLAAALRARREEIGRC